MTNVVKNDNGNAWNVRTQVGTLKPMRLTLCLPLMYTLLALLPSVAGCELAWPNRRSDPPVERDRTAAGATDANPVKADLLAESWAAYRQRFIQTDGRIIDREDNDRSTSEAQAYGLLRAVYMDDVKTFERVLNWSENNLQRLTNGKLADRLWVWKWGRDIQRGSWGILDGNFATDADIDAITALILASRRWSRPEYLQLAQAKLKDVWNLSTVTVGSERYLLPGPASVFQRPDLIKLNPSYLAPYAFRLFAQVDPTRDWMSLVRSSYRLLEESAQISSVSLPSDWVGLDPKTGQFVPLGSPNPLTSQYSFDAYRVWWRVALDADWFNAPEAKRYLQRHLGHLQQLWRSQQRIPARLDLQGQPLVEYEATSQYAMLYSAFRIADPAIAQAIYQTKLRPQYRDGFWDNNSAYYTQNLVWLGLLPPTWVSSDLLKSP